MTKDKSTSKITLGSVLADAAGHLKSTMFLRLNFSLFLFFGLNYLLFILFMSLIESHLTKLLAANANIALFSWFLLMKYLSIILSIPLLLGARWQAIKKCRGLPVRLIDQGIGYQYFTGIISIATIIILIMALHITIILSLKSFWLHVAASLICIYFCFSYSLAPVLVIDKQLRPLAALRNSYKLIANNWGIVLKVAFTEIAFFLLALSFLLFRFIPTSTLMHQVITPIGNILELVGILIVAPLSVLMSARLYTKIIEKEEQAKDAPKDETVNLHLSQV